MPVPIRPRVFALDPLQSEALELAQKHFDLVLPTDTEAGAWRQQADGLLVIGSHVTEEDFEQVSQAGKLKFLSKQGTGVDKIALGAAKKAGVPVMNTPGVNVGTRMHGSPAQELTIGASGS
jgi:phosphoglycerate dehydrogenase-like enzyme